MSHAWAVARLGLGDVVDEVSLGGGCIHDVRHITCRDGASYVAKIAQGSTGSAMLAFEAQGLSALRETGTVRVPAVLGTCPDESSSALVLEWLAPDPHPHWREGGRALGRLHMCPPLKAWGWTTDGWLGATPTRAGQFDDWCVCLGEGRLRPMVRQAQDASLLDRDTINRVEALISGLSSRIPSDPPQALLHGDLWSGNLHPTDRSVAVLDPACMVGDPLADIAMARLFGGVPEAYFEGWSEHGIDQTQARERIAAVQAMHMLNHVLLFGRSYISGLCRCLDQLSV